MSSRKLAMSVWDKDKKLGGIGIYGVVEARCKWVFKLGKVITGYLYPVKTLQNME